MTTEPDIDFTPCDETMDLASGYEDIFKITEDIQKINEMFNDLHDLVIIQKEPLDELEYFVQETNREMEAGNNYLVQASKYQNSANKLMTVLTATMLGAGVYLLIH
jgi:syntaxin 16